MTQVWDHAPYKGSDLLILLALADMANDSGKCWPSIQTLANKARLSERQTRIILKRLEAGQVICRDQRPGTSNIYTVNPFEPLNPTSPKPLLNHQLNRQVEPSIEPLLPEPAAGTAESDDAGHDESGVVVVVGEDGVTWPLDGIKNTTGECFAFRDNRQAKTFISKWLYAVSPDGNGIKNPVKWSRRHMDDPADPPYLNIVEMGPSVLLDDRFYGGEIDKLLTGIRSGARNILAGLIEMPQETDPLPVSTVESGDDEPEALPPTPSDRIYTRDGLSMAPNQAWDAALGQVQLEMPPAAFKAWVRDTALLDYDPDQRFFIAGSPTEMSRAWVSDRLTPTIEKLLTGITNKTIGVEFVTWGEWASEVCQTGVRPNV